MKEKIRESVGSITMIFACAFFVIATFLGAGRITAEASNKTFTYDLRDGKYLKSIGPESEVDRIMYVVADMAKVQGAAYEYEEDEEKHCHINTYKFNDEQTLIYTSGSGYVLIIKAGEGSTGTLTLKVSKENYIKYYMDLNYSESVAEEYAITTMKWAEEQFEGIEDGDGSSVYTFKFLLGTTSQEEKPAQEEKAPQVKDETPAAPTYEPGKTVEDGGLKYEILDKEGNLALIGVTNKKIKKIAIPATVNVDNADLKVTTVKKGAIKKLGKLTSIKLGANVTTLEKQSIYNNKNLKSLDIKAAKLTTVEKGAVGKPGQGFKIKLSKAQKKSLKSVLKKGGLSKYVK